MAGTTSTQKQHNLQSYSSAHIATNTTTLVKTGRGILHAVSLNTIGATGNICTIYDGIDNTGTVIAIIGTTVAAAVAVYDVEFATGLCVVTGTGTCADLTIIFL